MQKRKPNIPALVGKIAILAACAGWLAFVMYYWNSTASTGLLPKLSFLEAFMDLFSGSDGSMRCYFGSMPVPFMAFFLLVTARGCRRLYPGFAQRKGVRVSYISASCVLLAFTMFCNLCLSNIMSKAYRFWKLFGIRTLGDIKAAMRIFGTIALYIALPCLWSASSSLPSWRRSHSVA